MNTPIRFAGLSSGMDTQSMVQQLMRAESMKMDRLTKRRTLVQWRQEQMHNVITRLNDFRKDNTDYIRANSITNDNSWNTRAATVESASGEKVKGIAVKADPNAEVGSFDIEVVSLAAGDAVQGKKLFSYDISLSTPMHIAVGADRGDGSAFSNQNTSILINGRSILIEQTDSVQDFINKVNESEAGVKISYDTMRKEFLMESTTTGANATIHTQNDTWGIMERIGLDNIRNNTDNTMKTGEITDDPRLVQQAKNAKVLYDVNGVFTAVELQDQSSNTFEINGVTITLSRGVTEGEIYTINVETDTEQIMETIKEFVEQYNHLVRYINALHTTSRPRHGNAVSGKLYEPLTDEERKGLSDTELERWDEQAKTGLLHRDRDLRSLQSQMRSAMFAPVKVTGGKDNDYVSLFDVGITTVGRDGTPGDGLIGILQIDEAKLLEMLEKDPERVKSLFARSPIDAGGMLGGTIEERNARADHVGLGFRLDDILRTYGDDDQGPLRQRAGYTRGLMVSENTMSQQLRDFDNRLSAMERYLARRENHYYSMFSRMEQAIAQSNSQMDSLFAFSMQ
ncbi:MAG: flagellar filament capping protein FliD [Defluviitaleaceae bacterium]|nr:flagellar filament capping protein FliD [Defluviitaleaceae bacterium]